MARPRKVDASTLVAQEVAAEKLVAGGDALGHLPDGRVVFIRDALPGERVMVEIDSAKRDFAKGVATSIVAPSPARVEPPCVHLAAGCGGCTWQHATADSQLQFKTGIVAEALHRTARLPNAEVRAGASVDPWGYRTTLRLAVAADGTVGLRARTSHRIVPIETCMVAHPLLADLLPRLRVRRGKEISVRVSVATQEVTAVADAPRASIEGLPARAAVGPRAVLHETVAGTSLQVSAASFFQSGPQAANLLVAAVREMCVDLLSPSHGPLIDAYGGIGLFAATLAVPASMPAVVVESSRSACDDAKENVGALGQIVCSRFERWSPQPSRLVVADPARSGLGRDAVAVIDATGAERAILVSCDAASLARDAALLAEVGYRHVTSTVLDVFPHTPHVEVVTRFDRQ